TPKLTPELLFSVVAEDRTLDLQAENPQLHKRWVEGLRLRFQSFAGSPDLALGWPESIQK
ncbi:unnamed protein product, partial [Symbiodinium sp. CCMP2456]